MYLIIVTGSFGGRLSEYFLSYLHAEIVGNYTRWIWSGLGCDYICRIRLVLTLHS